MIIWMKGSLHERQEIYLEFINKIANVINLDYKHFLKYYIKGYVNNWKILLRSMDNN